MANKKETIFTKLNRVLSGDQPQAIFKVDASQFNNLSPEEIQQKTLETQQGMYLQNQWKKVDSELYSKGTYYEPSRLGAYADFESMEYFPEISVAMDVFADEATTASENGKVLTVYSDSPRIKQELETLFEDVLDINTNLPSWARNLPVKEDSLIPLLNGETVTIKELSERMKLNPEKEIWTYSIQDDTKNILPGKIIWCDLTRENTPIYKITLDDNSYLETTSDHEFIMRNGTKKRADQLSEFDSLMPFYTRISEKGKDKIYGYEKVYNPSTNHYKYTHRVVSHDYHLDLKYEKTILENIHTHHINFNKLNNEPANLKRLPASEHLKLHGHHAFKYLQTPEMKIKRLAGIDKYLRSDERKIRLSKEMTGIYPKYFEEYNHSELRKEQDKDRVVVMTNLWQNEDWKNDTRIKMKLRLSDECYQYIITIVKKHNEYLSSKKLSEILKQDKEFVNKFSLGNTHLNKDFSASLNFHSIKKLIEINSELNYVEFIAKHIPSSVNTKFYKSFASQNKTRLNHKVVSIMISGYADAYCMEVVGPNGESDRHNFPICSKFEDGTSSRNGVFVSNCKYGENFLYHKILPEKGIVGVTQLPNIEITRSEGKFSKAISSEENTGTKFNWALQSLEFNSFEISHFRLMGDDRKLPYGTSILEKCRRIHKQLLMAEDAMLVYRATRAPERRVYKVYVGNMDDKDIDGYVDKIANNFKRTSVTNSQNGNTDTRMNPMSVDQDFFIPSRDPSLPMPIETLPGACLDLDTYIPLMDGRTIKLMDIIIEWNNGNTNMWAYSCNPTTGEQVPGLITWAGVTRKDTNVLKITLDNGKDIIATPDHKFVHKTKGFVDAENLVVGDALMSLNPDNITDFSHKISQIEWLLTPQDTGTLTIDGDEVNHDYHTFATACGVFVKNSNLDAISDIVYLQNKLLSALRVPKSFLGFEEAMGDGKNLAILDIRFARAVHRVQKALIQELNKIAIIHLYLKGYTDELTNFTLSLASPSTQADMLKIQNWQTKMALYRDAVSDAGNGFSAMSMTKAKKDILGMSDDEIKLDVNRQVVEKAASEELKILGETIKQTGVFKEIYKVYKINPDNLSTSQGAGAPEDGGAMGGGGGGGGGGDMGGDMGGVGEDFTSGEEDLGGVGPDGMPLPAEEPGTEDELPTEEPTGEPTDVSGEDEPLNEISILGLEFNKEVNPVVLNEKRIKKLNEDILKTISEINKL